MPSRSRTLDDFAVPEEAQEMVAQHRPRIEHLFGVELNILGVLGAAQSPSGDLQGARKIWLQLQGHRDSLQRAKEYIKGLCAPELSEEVHYPKDMQCIFSGARGLFLDCLTQGTSAHLAVLRPGALLIAGLAEAFVMAQSRIQEFVEKHRRNPKLPEEREVQVKRSFRDLVENYDDKHAMDLLILPTALKEELLDLVKETQEEAMQQTQDNKHWAPHSSGENSSLEWEPVSLGCGGSGPEPPIRPQDDLDTRYGIHPSASRGDVPTGFGGPPESPRRAHDPVQLQGTSWLGDIRTNLPPMVDRPQDQTLPQAPRAGFAQDVAHGKRHARPQDFLSSLNGPLAWPETTAGPGPGLPRSSPKPIPALRTPPKMFPGLADSWEEKRQEERVSVRGPSPASLPEETSEEEPASNVLLSSWTEKEFKMRLDFFKTMGYEEQVVKKILLECGVREAPSTILDRVQMAEAGMPRGGHADPIQLELGARGFPPSPPGPRQDENEYLTELIKAAVANCGHSPSEIPMEIQTGAPLADLLRRLHEKGEQHKDAAAGPSAAKTGQGGQSGARAAAILDPGGSPQQRPGWQAGRGSPFREGSQASPLYPDVAVSPPGSPPGATPSLALSDSEGSCSAESSSLGALHLGPVSTVTGAQRFEEALQTEFRLKLVSTPGKKNLRMVIIDGSNVAMMHGLNQFFSCRGIALAVQYFWDRGHREVTVLVPQHRMEEDSNVREKHYLVELLKLSILSLTPSRKIDGKGVVPYDDRFMLRLAEKTNGVIVTNDQFRDLAKESKKWARIIKGSLLQYIFVGNIFMVPDDPLGREGPTLVEFLKKSPSRTKASNCHSFSGRPVPTPPAARPASQTEVLHLRDRRPPGSSTRRGPPGDTAEKETLRPKAETERLRRELLEIFVHQEQKVDFVLLREPSCQDLNKLSEAILNLTF